MSKMLKQIRSMTMPARSKSKKPDKPSKASLDDNAIATKAAGPKSNSLPKSARLVDESSTQRREAWPENDVDTREEHDDDDDGRSTPDSGEVTPTEDFTEDDTWATDESTLNRFFQRNLSCQLALDTDIIEDDADSGYHTGHNTLRNTKMSEQPSPATLTREDLRRSIEAFNHNQYGLIMTLHSEDTSFQGFIRVHMNLIRPINMSISTRPPSIYDVVPHSPDDDEEASEQEITSFYLPKDTSKVIHIKCETTTQEVIKALLTKYKITDNPRKFALYEKTTQNKRERLRRMSDDERPLPLCLSWTKDGLEGLDSHRFILQENDTGEILWEAFSIPELENFLGILNKEELDYLEQVKNKYRLLRIQMDRRLKEIKPKPASNSDPKRQPVFV